MLPRLIFCNISLDVFPISYGSELIDTFDSKSFTAEILTLKTAPVIRNNVVCYEEETGYPDDIPMYIPMK